MIRLEPVTPDNWRERLEVRPDQAQFVAPTTTILARAWAYRDLRSRVFMIYHDETPVGMALYHDYEDEELRCYVFDQLLIDARYQGNGYGKEALKLLIDFIRSAPCREAKYAWLCYNTANTVARNLYASVGFEEVPEAYDEEDDEMPAVLKL